jgi:hypothetical protein
MTPTEIGWEGGRGENDSETLYIYAKDPRIKLWQRSSRVCDVVRRPRRAPFGYDWWVSFAEPLDGKYLHGPYQTRDEAKAMAVTLWRLR